MQVTDKKKLNTEWKRKGESKEDRRNTGRKKKTRQESEYPKA